MASPYLDKPVEQWAQITTDLIQQHPLTPAMILDAAQMSWERLWRTRVGDETLGFPFCEINPPATVVGYMFEKLFAKELACRLPDAWRGGIGSEKDLHCLADDKKSVEMKASGQLGYRIYGNRSYGQVLENLEAGKKDKSGYYITVNFYGQTLTLLRFGWVDSSDWQAQKSATGQMAGLPAAVYEHKLKTIKGSYILDGPVQLVEGIGPGKAVELANMGITTIGQFLATDKIPEKFLRYQTAARAQHMELVQNS